MLVLNTPSIFNIILAIIWIEIQKIDNQPLLDHFFVFLTQKSL